MKKRQIFVCVFIGLLLAGCATDSGRPVGSPVQSVVVGSPPALPAAGDTAVYRVINAYNGETRGEVRYRVDKVDGNQVVVSVTTSTPSAGLPRTEVYTTDGNWLRHPVNNHDRPVDYDFAPPYPAYPFPLDVGKSWSIRVNATSPVTGRRNSVRVDVDVIGAEHITVPAGAFDTIKIKRRVYAGDWESFRRETNITETDWYAPALGRAVRTESNSAYLDVNRCDTIGPCDPIRGDWNIFELVSYGAK